MEPAEEVTDIPAGQVGPAEIAISVQGVSKDFALPHERAQSVKRSFTSVFRPKGSVESQHALRDISFEVQKGEFFGIVGRNGSGKSTLLKILAGIYRPTRGGVRVRGKLVPFIELGVGFNPELTGRENVYLNGALLGFSKKEMEAQYEQIVAFSELKKFMDQKLKNYSSGMQVRLAFSVAIIANADILLVDEVLAVGDAAFQRKCFNYFRDLKKNKQTVVFVSHDMDAVRRFCDRAILIEDSKLVMEGDAQKIADAYTKIFLKEARAQSQSKAGEELAKTRWGDEAGRFSKPQVEVTPKTIRITANITAKRTMVEPKLGVLVKNYEGLALFGDNSKQRRSWNIERMAGGDRCAMVWEYPNVLNEGEYTIDLGLGYDDGVTADWWQDAVKFDVVREKSNPFVVNPSATFKLGEPRQ